MVAFPFPFPKYISNNVASNQSFITHRSYIHFIFISQNTNKIEKKWVIAEKQKKKTQRNNCHNRLSIMIGHLLSHGTDNRNQLIR